MAKKRTKKVKVKKTDAQLAQEMRDAASAAEHQADLKTEEAEIMESNGRAGLRLFRKFHQTVAKARKLQDKLSALGISVNVG